MSMLLLAACLAAGFLAARILKLPENVLKATGWILTVILFLLVFLLGVKLGGDGSLIRQFGTIGVGSLVLGVGCTAGSILLAGGYMAIKALLRGRKN